MQDLSDILDVRDLGKLTQLLAETLSEGSAMVGHHMKLGGRADTAQPEITYDFGTRGLMVLRGDFV